MVGANGLTAKTQVNFDGTTPGTRVAIFDNIFGPATYGAMGNGTNGIPNTLAKFAPGAQVTANIFTGLTTTAYQVPGNWYPATLAAAGLPSAASGSYAFNAAVTAFASALAGIQMGPDSNLLNQLVASVTVP